MNYFDIIAYAEDQTSRFKHPDTREFIEAFNPICAELHLGGLDSVEQVSTCDNFLYITNAWSARGCAQTDYLEIPLTILKAEDPVKEARMHYARTTAENAKSDLANAKNLVLKKEQAYAKALKNLADLSLT